MLDDIKKGIYAGIGAVLLTRDKVEQVIDKFVKDSKLDREEGKRLVDDLVKAGEKQWSDAEAKILETVKKGIGTLDIGTRSEVDGLCERVDNLEKRILIMEETREASGTE
jgi:polyhydroxyalkanoate synthesis regulator phasin